MIPAVAASSWMSWMFSWLGPSPMIPGNIDSMAVTRLSSALGKTLEMYPTTKNAMASTGKTERKPK